MQNVRLTLQRGSWGLETITVTNNTVKKYMIPIITCQLNQFFKNLIAPFINRDKRTRQPRSLNFKHVLLLPLEYATAHRVMISEVPQSIEQRLAVYHRYAFYNF